MDARKLRHLLEYFAFRSLVCVVQTLSPRSCVSLAKGLAWVIFRVLPRKMTRYAVARDNLQQAFGDRYADAELDDIIYRMWVHLFRLVTEIIHLPRKLRLSNIVEAVDFRGRTDAISALCSGRPVMVVSGHFGNWEMAVSVFGLFGFPMGLVARDLDNPYLNRWFLQFRKFTGHRPISKNGGGADVTWLLQRRGHVALLGDQDAGPNGLFVNFFGRQASTSKSIALLAREYNALICVGYARRLDHETLDNGWPRYEIGCEEVIDPLACQTDDVLKETTQLFTAALERVIRRSPEQYFWVHRRWKSVARARVGRNKLASRKAG